MSIFLNGVLAIKSINGSRGVFCVGDLSTDVGNFRIKDALLDQYDPGQYKGKFLISNIYPASYTWRGKVSVEVRARLQEIILDDDETALPSSIGFAADEPDPIDEEKPVEASPVSPPATVNPEFEATASDTESMFNEELQQMIDAGGIVKLDPTVSRELFRRQRDTLKAMGYRFVVSLQHWIK